MSQDPFTAPDPGRTRAAREYAALSRISDRHRPVSIGAAGDVLTPLQALTSVVLRASGSRAPVDGESTVDDADLMAALTLVPRARADVDILELSLLEIARGVGMTWQQIAFGLGLGSAQAARQRHERLLKQPRTDPA